MHNSKNIFRLSLVVIISLGLSACARLPSPEGWSGGVVAENVLYIGTQEGDLRALIAKDQSSPTYNGGDLLWSYALSGAKDKKDLAIYGTPVVENNTIFFAGYNGYIYSVNLADAALDVRETWDSRVGDGDHIVGGVAVSGNTLIVGSNDGYLYGYTYDFSTENGTLEWKFRTNGPVWSTPVIDNGVAYFGSLDHHVYAVDITNGSQIWRSKTGGGVTAKPVVVGNKILVGSFDSNLYALDRDTGSTVWKFTAAERWYWGGAVATEEIVYAPSLDGVLYAIGIADGLERWRLKTDGPIIGMPAIIVDKIAVPSRDGGIYLVSLGSGEFEDQCSIGSKLKASLVSATDAIYFSDTDRSVRELIVKPNGNLNAGWVHFTEPDSKVQNGNWNCG